MDTKRLQFTGYSDDTFSCSGPGLDVDYDTCANGDPVTMLVEADGEALLVVGQYAPGLCAGWLIGIAPHDPRHADGEVPAWPIRYERNPDVSYSPLLVIDAPAGVRVTVVDDDGNRRAS